MKKKFVGILSLVLAFMFVVFVGCEKTPDEPKEPTNPAATLTLSKSEAEAIVGDTVSFTYTLSNSDSTVALSGSNAQLASYVDNEGTVTLTAKAAGTFILTLTAGKLEEKFTLTIENAPALSLSEEEGAAYVGESVTFTYELLYTDAKATVDSESTKVTISVKDNAVTVSASEVGEYEINVTAGDLEKTFTLVVTEKPAVTLSATFASVRYGDTYTLKYLNNTEDNVEITVKSGADVAEYEEVKAGEISITTKDGGTYVLEVAAGEASATFNLTVVAYNVFNAEGAKAYGPFSGFYKALDELYAQNMPKGSTVRNESGATVFEINDYAYAYINSEGTYLGIDNENVVDGRSNWWKQYYDQDNLDIYNTTEFDHITVGDPNDIRFVSRKTDWNAIKTDWAGSKNGNPSGIWEGWRVSSYKPGISVVEFNGWADSTINTTGLIDTYEITYDLTGSTMKPSQNNNQTTRGDLWIGESSGVNHIMGITFNAGNEAETSELADGATRSFYLFSEVFLPEGNGAQGERTLGDAIGEATWNADDQVWEFHDEVTIKLVYTDNGDGTWLWTFTATIDEDVKTMTYEYAKTAGFKEYRLIYGVNYTPELGEGRKVVDLENGGYWTGIIQTEATACDSTKTDEAFSRSISFATSRLINTAKYMGVYGCDVASFTLLGDPSDPVEVPGGIATSYPDGCQIDFFYTY